MEIAVDGVQTSPRYPAGMALRFARVLRYRPDKTPEQADTVQDVRRLHVQPQSSRSWPAAPAPAPALGRLCPPPRAHLP